MGEVAVPPLVLKSNLFPETDLASTSPFLTALNVWEVVRGWMRSDSLVLCLEMLLDEAMLDSRLLGLGRVRTLRLLSSTGTLQHTEHAVS